MNVALSDGQWAEVDVHILGCHVLQAIIEIRRLTGTGIKDAMDILVERYRKLRAERPADFACSHEEYWRGVYS